MTLMNAIMHVNSKEKLFNINQINLMMSMSNKKLKL